MNLPWFNGAKVRLYKFPADMRHGMNKDGAAYDGILVTDDYHGYYGSRMQGLPEESERLYSTP